MSVDDDEGAVDPTLVANKEDLVRCLRQLWVTADRPSYRSLSDWAIRRRRSLPRTTIGEVLNGKLFPRKAFLLTFIEACGVDPAHDDRWERAWNRLASLETSQSPDLTREMDLRLAELERTAAEYRARATEAEGELDVVRAELSAATERLVELEAQYRKMCGQIGATLNKMDVRSASVLLEELSFESAAEQIASMDPQRAAGCLVAMEAGSAIARLAAMSAADAAKILSSLGPDLAATLFPSGAENVLDVMDQQTATNLLAAMDPTQASNLLIRMPLRWTAERLEAMRGEAAKRLLEALDPIQAAKVLESGSGVWALNQLAVLGPHFAAQVLGVRNNTWTRLDVWESQAATERLGPLCGECGRVLGNNDAFCGSCGTPHATLAWTTEEERRQVSVLFVDLVDFTPYVERADPELVRGMQQGFFTTARRVIGQYGGVVEKYIGDAVMAQFGASVATETDPLRCVRAGLELQRVLARFAPTGSYGMRFRVGVATGDVIVDLTAARDGGQAIVAGDVVNTAARIQSMAPPGAVLVCGTTYALTSSAIRYEPQPPVVLRGRSAPTEVWLALSPVQRQQADHEPDTTPLVDREHELGLLINALHRTLQDRTPQLVTVFGQAGIGKSRLVRELFRHAERLIDQPVTWRTGHCPPFGENVTVAALADILKAETGILDTDTAVAAEARLAEAVRDLVGPDEVNRLVGALRPLIGLTGSTLPAKEAESAWRQFLVAGAAGRPTVLVFEDVHWADDRMRRFIELLGASARDVPLLVLCTARPELVDRDPSWAGTIGGSLTITLPPLRSAGIATLFTHLFKHAAFSADLLSPLIELADGNPLYAQEYARMVNERGEVRPGRPGQELPMPDSVHAVIANRIDLLDGPDRTVLLAASVVGTHFWPGAVAAALGRPVEMIERSLRRLEQREFVFEQPESTMAGQSEFRFRHVLVRDVCYQRLPRSERVARHERTAGWLDAVSQSRDTDLAEVLAHHRWAAYEIARDLGVAAAPRAPAAVEALRRAARRAYALHSLNAAAAHVHRALSLSSAEPAATGMVQRLDLELLGVEIAFHRDHDEFLSTGGPDQLTTIAEQLLACGDQRRAARAWTLLGQTAWLRANRAEALSFLDHAVRLLDALPDTPEKADAYAELGRLHMLDYERDQAIAAADAAARIAERLGLAEVQANARITLGIARYQSGDRTGLAALEEVYQYCRTHQLFAVRRAAHNLAYAAFEEGDRVRSDALRAEGGEVLVGQNETPSFTQEVSQAYFAGEFDKLLAAADAFAATPSGQWDLHVRGMRACVRLLQGKSANSVGATDTENAGQTQPDDIADFLRIARISGFRRVLWMALSYGALCRALQGRTDDAIELLAELAETRHGVPALVSSVWSAPAAVAAALGGRTAALSVKASIGPITDLTPWGYAALSIVDGVLASAEGEYSRAADLFTEAAQIYGEMPNTTERMLCLALAADPLSKASHTDKAEQVLSELRSFARNNHAPRLLSLVAPAD